MELTVTKRDGSKEPLDLEKFHRVVAYACEGIAGVSASEVEIRSHIQFYDKITSKDIQETLIKAASDLICDETPNYHIVAGRLVLYDVRKEAYGQFEPHTLYDQVVNIAGLGFYEKKLLEWYTKEEFEQMDKWIDHSRDENIAYAGMEQMRGKYLVKNRNTGQIYESPQIAMMLVAATIFHRLEDRMTWIKDFYNALSNFDISLPTPQMAGVRTPVRQFASCVLIESGDDLDSIYSVAHAIGKYVSQRAGIGINGGRLRALGSSINNGHATHTGVTPFFKLWERAVKSCSQGGVRGGAATLYYPFWHYELEDMLVLKNNKGTENNRVRQLDYGVQFNRVMYERLINDEDITLFSPSDVPELYEPFFTDVDKFRELYEQAERKTSIRKKKMPAAELFSKFIAQRGDTGRKYVMNTDHANDHGSFIAEKAAIHMSNLCTEITLPTTPLKSIDDEEAEIATCNLGAINWGNIKEPADFERPAQLLVKALNELIDYQEYPVIAAELATKARRPLGIGIINFAFWLAKNGSNYSEPNLKLIDEWTEAWSYYLIKASSDLAFTDGPCPKSDETKYSQGILPVDTYKTTVDELVPNRERMPWKSLRNRLMKYGIRNSTLMALMPSETSSQISNATNGIEPPKSLVTVKTSKDGILPQVVPQYHHLKNKYECLWDMKSPVGYLHICAVLQKWIDQGISVNTSYNPEHFPKEEIPESVMLEHMIMFYQQGGKQLYYNNVNDGATDDEDAPEEGEMEPIIEDDCSACKI